jgi:ubiquitin-protein ligase E3 C
MFPNFTGSSRKTRNVNLSGQRAINPFTNASFAGAPTGASKTVAQAQAERQQRQRERERLKAALGLQRVWRGYKVRRALRDGRRQLLDEVCTGSVEDDVQMEDGGVAVAVAVDGDQALRRSIQALPLLFSVYQTSNPGDYQRLRLVLQDLIGSRFGAFSEGGIASARLKELVRIVVAALAR